MYQRGIKPKWFLKEEQLLEKLCVDCGENITASAKRGVKTSDRCSNCRFDFRRWQSKEQWIKEKRRLAFWRFHRHQKKVRARLTRQPWRFRFLRPSLRSDNRPL